MPRASADIRPMSRPMADLLVVASILVFIIGIPLFILSGQTEQYFAWTIASPLTAAFLGGSYWASCLLELMASREKRWSNARIAVPAVLLFTTLTLVVTLLHLDRFHINAQDLLTRFVTWVWIVVYATVPIIMVVLLVMQYRTHGEDAPRTRILPRWIRALLGVQGVIMLGIGIALLIVPLSVAPLWPWALTELTGRAIGAWLTALGVAALHSTWENDFHRIRPAIFSYGLLVILQLIAVVRYPDEVSGSGLRLGLYMLFLASMAVVPIALIREDMKRHG